MPIVTLTFTGSIEEIVSGIPSLMTIGSNIPSTIHFTLDGSVPSVNSPIYINTFSMPDGVNSVTLSAFGIDSDGYIGSVLTQVFAPNTTQINVSRHVGLEGFVVDSFADLTNIEDGFDADGNAVSFIDKPLIDLDVIHSSKGRLGLAAGAQIEILTPDPLDTAYPFDDNFVAVSSNSDAQFFNPFAKTIVIDDRIDNDIKILNRPWGSIRTVRKGVWGQREIGGVDSTYISGGFVRTFYSAKNNTMVSYYFDHNEGRYVKSIQNLPTSVPTIGKWTSLSQPLVFKWIDRGRHSTIPL